MAFDGTDLIEIIIDLERKFHLRTSSRDFDKCRTAGDLADRFAELLSAPQPGADPCPTARRFFELRHRLAAHETIPFDEIQPETNTATFLPPNFNRDDWSFFAANLHLPLPKLRWTPRAANILFLIIVIFFTLAAGAWTVHSGGKTTLEAIIAIPVATLVTGALCEHLLRFRFASAIPAQLHTLSGLALLAASTETQRTTAHVWATVQYTLAEIAQIHPRRIRRRTTLQQIAQWEAASKHKSCEPNALNTL